MDPACNSVWSTTTIALTALTTTLTAAKLSYLFALASRLARKLTASPATLDEFQVFMEKWNAKMNPSGLAAKKDLANKYTWCNRDNKWKLPLREQLHVARLRQPGLQINIGISHYRNVTAQGSNQSFMRTYTYDVTSTLPSLILNSQPVHRWSWGSPHNDGVHDIPYI